MQRHYLLRVLGLCRQAQRRYKMFSCTALARPLCPTPLSSLWRVWEEGWECGRTNRKLIHTNKYSRMILTVSHDKVDNGSMTPILSLVEYWRIERLLCLLQFIWKTTSTDDRTVLWQDGNIECLRVPMPLTVPGTRYRRNNYPARRQIKDNRIECLRLRPVRPRWKWHDDVSLLKERGPHHMFSDVCRPGCKSTTGRKVDRALPSMMDMPATRYQ